MKVIPFNALKLGHLVLGDPVASPFSSYPFVPFHFTYGYFVGWPCYWRVIRLYSLPAQSVDYSRR